MLRNTPFYYGGIAKLFHWLMAIAVIGMFGFGLYMVSLPLGPDKLYFYGIHKSVGVAIFMLVFLRLLWRFSNVVPILPDSLASIQRIASHIVHFLLYAFMIAMPISGWLMSSAAGFPVSFFGLFTLPDLIGVDKFYHGLFKNMHMIGAFIFMGIVAMHFGAALFHHFVLKDSILRRMLPWVNSSSS